MNTSMSIRDLTRKGKSLADYDYIDIEDKKSHQYKGVFISSKYAEEVKHLVDMKLQEEKEKQLRDLLQFAGIANDDTENKSIQELKSVKARKYE